MAKAVEGEYTRDLIPVRGNVYCIPERLKEIDDKYFVMFNRRRQRFEIHHAGQPFWSFCLFVPYDELDARTVEYVMETRRERTKQLIAEMEKQNEKLEIDKMKRAKDEVEYYAGEMYDWENRHTEVNSLEKALRGKK